MSEPEPVDVFAVYMQALERLAYRNYKLEELTKLLYRRLEDERALLRTALTEMGQQQGLSDTNGFRRNWYREHRVFSRSWTP